jgi:hypothetical protein
VQAVGWLGRLRSFGRRRAGESVSPPGPIIRSAPGLADLFGSLESGKSHVVLDLGTASDASLSVYAHVARQVRFADLGGTPETPPRWDAPLGEAARAMVDRYDVLLLWDTLGWLPREERKRFMARVGELAAPNAWLHLVVEAPERTGPRPVRFGLADTGRMRYELADGGTVATSRLLPADVEKALAPFEVVRAFTLKDGLREYLAVRRPAKPPTKAVVA